MLISAAEVLRERGAAGVTIDEVLARSGAPRGSVYYHFPEGRNQILTEALQYAGEALTEVIDEAAAKGGIYLVRQFVEFWDDLLVESDFTAGCPVVAAAIGSADDDPQLTTVAGNIFRRWRDALTARVRERRLRRAAALRRWRSRASPPWRVRWCCAGPPAVSTRCATSPSRSNS